jgi:lysylphosphatidylglycerol synthetase-like protein (DUF2156 family)
VTLAQDRLTSTVPNPRAVRTSRPSGPPPRPQLTSDVVPPWLRTDREVRPRLVPAVAVVVAAAVAAALTGMLAMAADGAGLRDRLTAAATKGDPSASAELVRSGVRTTLLLLFGMQSVLVVLLVVGVVLLLRRLTWARWALLGIALVTLALAALAQDVVAGGRDLDRLAFVVEGGLLLVTSVLLLSRPIGTWLRSIG